MRGSRPPWQVGASTLVLYLSAGWGATEQHGHSSDTLQVLEVEVAGEEECRAAMADLAIGAGMLCAGGVEGQAPCGVSAASSTHACSSKRLTASPYCAGRQRRSPDGGEERGSGAGRPGQSWGHSLCSGLLIVHASPLLSYSTHRYSALDHPWPGRKVHCVHGGVPLHGLGELHHNGEWRHRVLRLHPPGHPAAGEPGDHSSTCRL